MTTVDYEVRVRTAPAWWTIAVAETRLVVRNKAVLATAGILPLCFGLTLITSDIGALSDSSGGVAAMQVGALQIFGIFMATTMTLASRRQQLYLKRLRTSAASTASIVTGLVAPPVTMVLVQTVLVLVATSAATDSMPAHPELLVLAYLVGSVMAVALGFMTATFTRNPEAAQITVMPGMLVLMGGVIWALMVAPDEIGIRQLVVPGGALADLTRTAWDGPAAGTGYLEAIALPAFLALTVSLAVSAIAAKLFRWQPRALSIGRPIETHPPTERTESSIMSNNEFKDSLFYAKLPSKVGTELSVAGLSLAVVLGLLFILDVRSLTLAAMAAIGVVYFGTRMAIIAVRNR